jgi:hypothetical protein
MQKDISTYVMSRLVFGDSLSSFSIRKRFPGNGFIAELPASTPQRLAHQYIGELQMHPMVQPHFEHFRWKYN